MSDSEAKEADVQPTELAIGSGRAQITKEVGVRQSLQFILNLHQNGYLDEICCLHKSY